MYVDVFRSLLIAAAASLLLAPALAQAAPSLQAIVDDHGVLQRIEISGEQRAGCPPLLNETRIEGNEITLLAKPDSKRCTAQVDHYQLEAVLESGDLSADHDTWRVRYLVQDDPIAPPQLHAFALLSKHSLRTPEPESGFWWTELGGEFDHSGPGLGAQIERQGHTLALTFTGYDEEGRPEWLFGASALESASTAIELSHMTGGRGPFGSHRGPDRLSLAGHLQIEWLSNARAIFWFSREKSDGRGLELTPVSMVRFDFGQRPGTGWAGRWLFEVDGVESVLQADFVILEDTTDSFVLVGAQGETLVCTRAEQRPQSPPERCDLSFDNGSTTWRFNDIGLSTLHGTDDQGHRIRGFRLPR